MELKRKRNQSDSIIFNGHDLSKLVYCKVRRPIMASVSASFEDAPGRHGEYFKNARRSGYDLQVDMWLRTEHRREVAHRRAAVDGGAERAHGPGQQLLAHPSPRTVRTLGVQGGARTRTGSPTRRSPPGAARTGRRNGSR